MSEDVGCKFHIRRMTQEDIQAAVAIERICFANPWTKAAYQATLLLPYAHYFVAEMQKIQAPDYGKGSEEDSHVVGIIGLELISGDGEISNVAVLPTYRRQGIAHALMEEVLKDGEANQIRNFTLEVRESNTAARALYESFGFVTEGVRRNYYDTPTENALIMWRR